MLDVPPGDERVKFFLKKYICQALARRGRIEYFFKIKELSEKVDPSTEKGEFLLNLTYLALQGKGKYLKEMEQLLGNNLKTTNIQIGEVVRSIWAAGFKQFKDRLEQIATSSPADYEDEDAYVSGSYREVNGRYHIARKVCTLWNEQDPVTRCKLWIAFGLDDSYEIMENQACKLRMKEELSNIASGLTREKKDEIIDFIAFCNRETLDKWKSQTEFLEMVRYILGNGDS